MPQSLSSRSGLRNYFRLTRTPRYSFLFALPLLVLYETMAAVLASGPRGVRNGADVMVKSFFIAIAGRYGPIVFAVLLIGGCIWLIWRDRTTHVGPMRAKYFLYMIAESATLAALFGAVVGTLTAGLLGQFHVTRSLAPQMTVLMLGPADRLGGLNLVMISLGAGLYEELLFRVVLVSALAFVAHRAFGWSSRTASIAAAVTSALIFSAFHYIGPYGDRLALASFVFRFLSGLAFSALYLLRGFGITAWTHALYDLLLLLR